MKRWYYEALAKDKDGQSYILISKSFWNPYGYIGSRIIRALVKKMEGIVIVNFNQRKPLYHSQIIRKI